MSYLQFRSMQQSTVWWTRRGNNQKGPTQYGGGTNWYKTNQSRGINNEEEGGMNHGVEGRQDRYNLRLCYVCNNINVG